MKVIHRIKGSLFADHLFKLKPYGAAQRRQQLAGGGIDINGGNRRQCAQPGQQALYLGHLVTAYGRQLCRVSNQTVGRHPRRRIGVVINLLGAPAIDQL